jgi:hypothetical protein
MMAKAVRFNPLAWRPVEPPLMRENHAKGVIFTHPGIPKSSTVAGFMRFFSQKSRWHRPC